MKLINIDNKLNNKTIVSTKGSENIIRGKIFQMLRYVKKVTNSAASTNTKNYDDVSPKKIEIVGDSMLH